MELLVVIVILAILTALLLPAINGALRTARNSAVSAEINQLAQALADFKSKYGDYPPSRFLAVEGGNYSAFLSDTTPLQGGTMTDPYSPGIGDITLGQLAQRSVAALRKFFPRVSTMVPLPKSVWYDFNGNGTLDNPYILHGHECLVFFLGGVPLPNPGTDPAAGTFGLTGFGKDPTNPFTNSIVGNAMYNANRQPPFFQFNPGRLFLDPVSGVSGKNWVGTGIPGYYDTLNIGPPLGTGSMNFYAYFSSYGNGNYDPNDVNFTETDAYGNSPIELEYFVNFPTASSKAVAANIVLSPSPNPYTSTTTKPPTGTVSYQNAQTFQIISAGPDGQYGVGGQFVQSAQSAAAVSLPFDSANTYYGSGPTLSTDSGIRTRENDNLTNFKQGTLQ